MSSSLDFRRLTHGQAVLVESGEGEGPLLNDPTTVGKPFSPIRRQEKISNMASREHEEAGDKRGSLSRELAAPKFVVFPLPRRELSARLKPKGKVIGGSKPFGSLLFLFGLGAHFPRLSRGCTGSWGT